MNLALSVYSVTLFPWIYRKVYAELNREWWQLLEKNLQFEELPAARDNKFEDSQSTNTLNKTQKHIFFAIPRYTQKQTRTTA
jgi:hypothetical protein